MLNKLAKPHAKFLILMTDYHASPTWNLERIVVLKNLTLGVVRYNFLGELKCCPSHVMTWFLDFQNEKMETVGSETEAYAIADTMAVSIILCSYCFRVLCEMSICDL